MFRAGDGHSDELFYFGTSCWLELSPDKRTVPCVSSYNPCYWEAREIIVFLQVAVNLLQLMESCA